MPCVRITIKLIYDLGQFGSHGEVMTGFGNLESFLVCYSLAPVYISLGRKFLAKNYSLHSFDAI